MIMARQAATDVPSRLGLGLGVRVGLGLGLGLHLTERCQIEGGLNWAMIVPDRNAE